MSDLRAVTDRVETDPRSPREVIGVDEIVGRPEWLSTPTDPEMHLRVNIRFQKLVAAAAAMSLPAQR